MITEITDTNVKGWLLFDGECLLCRSLAARFAPTLHRHHYALTPLQAPWVMARFERSPAMDWSDFLYLPVVYVLAAWKGGTP